jgi:hypothetical protein
MAIDEDVYCTVSDQQAKQQQQRTILTATVARDERCVSSRYTKQHPYHKRRTRLTTPPGAAVLAHSLRDCGTSKKLAVLVTPDTLRPSTIDELRVSSTKQQSHCRAVY